MKKRNSKAHDLFLLMFNLSQLSSKEKIIDVFVEALLEIWPGINFEHQSSISYKEENCIKISSSKGDFGCVQIRNITLLQNEDFDILNNAIAMLAVILHKNEQDRLLEDEKLHLQKLVNEKIGAIRESEQEFRILAESMPQIVWATRPDGWNVYFNQQWVDYTGMTLEESYGHGWNKPFHPDDRQRAWDAWQNAVNNNGIYSMEARLRRFDGEYRWWLVRGVPQVNEKGEILKWFGTCTDIEEIKQTENKLAKSEGNFKNLMESTPLPLCYVNKEGVFTFRNKRFIEIFGYTETDVPGINEWWLKAYPDEQYRKWVIQNWENAVKNAAETNTDIQSDEYNVTCKDGSVHVIIISGKTLGENLIVTLFDITERKKVELQLNESEEKFRLAFKTSPDSVNINRLEDGLYVDINDSFTQITGYTREEIIGKTSHEIHIWTSMEDRSRLVDGLKKTGKVENLEAKFKMRNGQIIDGLMSAALTSINNIPHILSITRDITDRKQVEESLRESETKFRGIYEQSPIAIEIFDKEGKLIDINQQTLEMFGVDDKKYVIGFDLWADPNFSDEKVKQLKNGEPVFLSTNFDFEKVKKSNLYPTSKSGIMYMDMYAIPFVVKNLITGYLVQIIDVSERKQMLKTLKDRNVYIESILENMPIGFALNTISDGDVKYINNRFEEIYGWSRDILTNTGIFFEKVFPEPEYRKKMQTKIIADMESGDPGRMNWDDLKIVTSTGEVRYVHAYNIPLIEQNLMISTVQDTTKRKIAENELIKHRDNLEELVKARTIELVTKNTELEKFNNLFIDREFRIKELRNEIKELKKKVKNAK